MRLSSFLLLALALPLPAQQPPAQSSQVSGTVMCDDTQGPARDAGVELIRMDKKLAGHFVANPFSAHTDIYGRFVIPRVPNGTYVLLVSYAGYLSPLELRNPAINHNGRWVDDLLAEAKAHGEQVVTVSGNTTAPTVTLTRSASFSGHVRYADGAPASNVGLVVEDAVTGDEILPSHHSDRVTDDFGHFRLSGFPTGRYRVAALVPYQASQSTSPTYPSREDVSDLRLYSGDTLHAGEAKLYTLHPPEAANDIEITIPLGVFHTVQGAVVAPDGAPINGGEITLTDNKDEDIAFTVFPDMQGEFTIGNVPAGTYTLKLTAPAIKEQHIREKLGGGTNWFATIRAFTKLEQGIIVTDSDPSPLILKPSEIHLDPAKVKHDAETPPDFTH